MTVEAIDVEVAELRARLPDVERVADAAQAKVDAADRTRVVLAYDVHVRGDTAKQAKLERAATDFDAALREGGDARRALQQLDVRFGELATQRQEAEQRAYGADLQNVSADLQSLGKDLDHLLAAAAQRMQSYVYLGLRAANLRKKVGLGPLDTPKGMGANIVLRHFSPILHPRLEHPYSGRRELLSFQTLGETYGRLPNAPKEGETQP